MTTGATGEPRGPKLARRMGRVSDSQIMALIRTTAGGDYLSFASGLPDPELYPIDTLRGITDHVLRTDGRAALQYGPAEGFEPLREYVAEMLRARGLIATPEHILITNGSQQAIDLAARALLDPGDPVVVESPTYLAALQAFDGLEAAYRPVRTDALGMVTADLAGLRADQAKLVYTLPNFQNPTGLTLPADRRRDLAAACATAGVALFEDDAYHDLRYDGDALPVVCGLAENPGALYSGTFSKVIAPGLRVGYLWGAPALIRRLTQLKQIADLHTGSLTQRVVYAFCAAGHLAPAIHRLQESYRRRRDVLLGELDRHATGVCRWTHPQGGMFVWVTLANGGDASELLRRAMGRGVVFVPGVGFHPEGGGTDTLRLNFVSLSEDDIRRGIRILAELMGSL